MVFGKQGLFDCYFFMEQSAQKPLMIREYSLTWIPLGRLLISISCLSKQMVLPHSWQWKAGWISRWCEEPQKSWQMAYFVELLPSFIWWITPFCSKVWSVRNNVALSPQANKFSKLAKDNACFCDKKTSQTSSRLAVIFTFFSSNISTLIFFIYRYKDSVLISAVISLTSLFIKIDIHICLIISILKLAY